MSKPTSINGVIEAVAENSWKDPNDKLSFAMFDNHLTDAHMAALGKALLSNTTVKHLDLQKKGLDGDGAMCLVDVIVNNKTLVSLDIGYNNISGPAIVALCDALKANTTLAEVKIHRQEKDYGTPAEMEIVKLWETNTTLNRLYATLHDRASNTKNTRGEVRNQEIARRKEAGKPWNDLDPDPLVKAEYLEGQRRHRETISLAKAELVAPISTKVESTGGPYTLKQLTCAAEFLPDDVDKSKKESYLNDEEFETTFKMDKAAFDAAPGWKKNTLKKEARLH